jgi:hypothetical protein
LVQKWEQLKKTRVNVKKSGWPGKVEVLRNKFIKGNLSRVSDDEANHVSTPQL